MKETMNITQPHFLEAEVSISTTAFNRIVQEAIRTVVSKPEGFWIESLHFFRAEVTPSSEAINVRYSIADIPDAKGHFSKSISDDQFKAALMESMLSDLFGVVTELCEMEYWPRVINIRKFERNLPRLPVHDAYLRWLNRPESEKPLISGI